VIWRVKEDFVNTWRLITHHEKHEEALQIYLHNAFIALGWGRSNDLRKLRLPDASAIAQHIASIKNFVSAQSAGQGGRCLWGFHHEMEVGDFVILSKGLGPLPYVVEVAGDYYWDDKHPLFPGDDYFHRRKVRRRPDLDGGDLWTGPSSGWNSRWALVKL
jgi:predicted Mrr-cat superfamily restriction endonuclease